MEFPANAIQFMDHMVSEHKRRLRSRRPASETLRYMGETLDELGRGEVFLTLWVHNPNPRRPEPTDPDTDLGMLQLYEHWRTLHNMRPIEPWDGTKLRPWLSSDDNPAIPSALCGDLSVFSDAVTRAPGSETPWRRLDALGHALESYFTQIRRHAVWARPAISPAPHTARNGKGHSDSHSLSAVSVSRTSHNGEEHSKEGSEHGTHQAQENSSGLEARLRLYFHNELNNLETAPYSVRFWGFLKWADNCRRRLLGLRVEEFSHDRWSDIAFADEMAIKHFSWHDDVFARGASPRWDDQWGRYQTHKHHMGTQGYGIEFFQFHRDLVTYYNQWLEQMGRPRATAWTSGKHHTAYVMKYAGEAWWGRSGSNGRCLRPQDVAMELLDPELSDFATLAELGHYLDVGWPTLHGVGHVQNCDIRDPYCNNYSIRFFGWHLWLDELFQTLERQGKPLYDESKSLDDPIPWRWKRVPDPAPLLDGVWTYRSFHNDPDPNVDPRWFVASLELRQLPDGTLRGRLDSGDPDYIYEVDGFLDETSVRYETEPNWWDDRLLIIMRARGITTATRGHEYEYAACYQPRFPMGKSQGQAFVGSVLRAKRPDDPNLEGKVGSFVAVWRGSLPAQPDHGHGQRLETRVFTRSGEFVVPEAVTEVLIRAWGAGGGGGSDGPGVGADDGQAGTASVVSSLLRAGGGSGGRHGVSQTGIGGKGGQAEGGTTNTPGEDGETGATREGISGKGGDSGADDGGKGGGRVGLHSNGSNGGNPGGGGSGAQEGNTPGGGGGGGAFSEKRVKVTPGARLPVTIGDGGKGGDGGYRIGGAGAPGRVEISWMVSHKHE